VGHFSTRDTNGESFFHVKHIMEKIKKITDTCFKIKSKMIKWGTFGQHIWGTYGQFQKKNWQRYKFYTFQIWFKKKIVFDSLPNKCIPPFLIIAMSTLILIFLWN
jgi:hypothetical protein